uniref:Acyl-CoA dehydrogenase/oxidase C-terminal domain-containing protein n=1 Tax=Ralstonia solanacearum TaxID=305 RepID=A0A0S4VAS7_RALSL|nr:conserved protein of unknown function [Ralstonia solanacearum]
MFDRAPVRWRHAEGAGNPVRIPWDARLTEDPAGTGARAAPAACLRRRARTSRAGRRPTWAQLPAADASEAANACLQRHGGFGFAAEYDVAERTFRERRRYRVVPISTHLILSQVGCAGDAVVLPRRAGRSGLDSSFGQRARHACPFARGLSAGLSGSPVAHWNGHVSQETDQPLVPRLIANSVSAACCTSGSTCAGWRGSAARNVSFFLGPCVSMSLMVRERAMLLGRGEVSSSATVSREDDAAGGEIFGM